MLVYFGSKILKKSRIKKQNLSGYPGIWVLFSICKSVYDIQSSPYFKGCCRCSVTPHCPLNAAAFTVKPSFQICCVCLCSS